MTTETESNLQEILNDPNKRKTARSGMRILQVIRTLMDNKKNPNPSNITLAYYEVDTNKLSDTEISTFINKRRSMISRKLSELQDIRLVMPMKDSERTDGRSIPYHLTLLGMELLNNEDAYLSVMEDRPVMGDIPNDNGTDANMEYRFKHHSERIRALLKKIKEEISRIFDRDFIPDDINPAIIRFKANNLSFENDTLYDDLKNHIGTFLGFDTLETKLDELRTSVNRYLDLEEKVRRIIISELSRELGLVYSEHHDSIDSFGPHLVDWVVRNLYYLHSQDDDLYLRYTSDLTSEKERISIGNEKAKQVRIDGAVVMVLPINKKESYYLGKVSDMMESMNETPVQEHYSGMVAERMKAKDIQNQIIHSLEKEIEIPIYSGRCQYIKPV